MFIIRYRLCGKRRRQYKHHEPQQHNNHGPIYSTDEIDVGAGENFEWKVFLHDKGRFILFLSEYQFCACGVLNAVRVFGQGSTLVSSVIRTGRPLASFKPANQSQI
jgi:hypothetical protein